MIMATKKEQRQADSLEQAAVAYREKMQAIKALEKEAAPLKEMLLNHARALGVDSVELGGLTLERRVTKGGVINPERIDPTWIDCMQMGGYFGLLKISVNAKEVDPSDRVLAELLCDAGYREKENITYAVRI